MARGMAVGLVGAATAVIFAGAAPVPASASQLPEICAPGGVSALQLADGEVDVGSEVDPAEEQDYDRWMHQAAPVAAQQPGVDVDVYIHNFYRTDAQQLTERQAFDQVERLNLSYAGRQGGAATRFEFVLQAFENIPVDRARVEINSGRGDRPRPTNM